MGVNGILKLKDFFVFKFREIQLSNTKKLVYSLFYRGEQGDRNQTVPSMVLLTAATVSLLLVLSLLTDLGPGELAPDR